MILISGIDVSIVSNYRDSMSTDNSLVFQFVNIDMITLSSLYP
jgi:hypothetical protein